MSPLILASSSPYRRQLLDKLGLAYHWASPAIDETPLPKEKPEDLVVRLAKAKAHALAGTYPTHLIIGADQVSSQDGQILGKPGNLASAFAQLQAASGKTLTFFTGLCLFNSRTGHCQNICETYEVSFRQLTETQIQRYLNLEQPFDCAGSFKCEGLGISLFRSMQGRDPNCLVGLPLMALIDMLINEGIDPLAEAESRTSLT